MAAAIITARDKFRGAEWAVVLSVVDEAFESNPYCQGLKIDTPAGEMMVRHSVPFYAAWINSKGLAFGRTPRLAVLHLTDRLADRIEYHNQLKLIG